MRRVFVAGHRGMVGSAIVRRLERETDVELVTADRAQVDLTDQRAVQGFLASAGVEQVYLAAAKVGGIAANDAFPAEFLYQNLMIEANLIEAAHRAGVQQLVFLGSSCIYPRLADQPIREDSLLTGPLELTNEPYAIAKIAGIKLCESYHRQYGRDYRSLMPTNLYGPGDNFHPQHSHVLPALIRRFHEAKLQAAEQVVVWGSGTPRREFLHVDDLAEACVLIAGQPADQYWTPETERCSQVNVGVGEDLSIAELAALVAEVVGYTGEICFDPSKPDGTPRKLLDVSRVRGLGWRASIPLHEGLTATYQWFLDHADALRSA